MHDASVLDQLGANSHLGPLLVNMVRSVMLKSPFAISCQSGGIGSKLYLVKGGRQLPLPSKGSLELLNSTKGLWRNQAY